MKQADNNVIQKMVDYCDRIDTLMDRFGRSFDSYQQDFAYQYAVTMEEEK